MWRPRSTVIDLVLFLILVLVLTYPASLDPASAVIGDAGDSLLNAWILSWNGHKIFSGEPASLFHANIFHPHRYTLAYSENLLGITIFVLPVIRIWQNPLLTYNAAFFLSLYLSAVGAYLLVRHLASSRPAAFCSGLIFAFFPWRFGHLSHLQLQAAQWIPFSFLFLHRLWEKPSWRDALLFSLFFALQFLSCSYYGLYLAVFVSLFIVIGLLRNLRLRTSLKPLLRRMTLALALVAAITGPVGYQYRKVSREMGFTRPIGESSYYSGDIVSYLRVSPRLRFWGGVLPKHRPESNLFPGSIAILLGMTGVLITLRRHANEEEGRSPPLASQRIKRRLLIILNLAAVLLAASVVAIMVTGGVRGRWAGISFRATDPWRPFWILVALLLFRTWLKGGIPGLKSILVPRARRAFTARFYLLVLVLALLFSLGPLIRYQGRALGTGPYQWLYDFVPGFEGLRVPARFVIMVAFALSVFAGFGLAGLIKAAPRLSWVFPLLASALIVLESAASISRVEMPTGSEIPEVYRWLARQEGDFAILELPLPASAAQVHREARYLYFSTYHWKRLVNGYSGFFPPDYDNLYQSVIREFPSEDSIAYIRDLGTKYLIIHYRRFRSAVRRDLEDRVSNKFPHLLRPVERFEGTVVYEILSEEIMPPVISSLPPLTARRRSS